MYVLSAKVIKQSQILNLARLYVVNVARLFQTRFKKYNLNGGILRFIRWISNDRSRIGMSTTLARHDMGLSTIIGRTDRDASGQKIDAGMRSAMERLRTWDLRTKIHTPTDRSLKQAFFQLEILKDKLGLPDTVVEKAAYIYRKAQERQLVRGRTISGILAAAVYIACREMGISRTLKDIVLQ